MLFKAWMLHRSGKYIPVDTLPVLISSYDIKDIVKLQDELESSWFMYDLVDRNIINTSDDEVIRTYFDCLDTYFMKYARESNKIRSRKDIKNLMDGRNISYKDLYEFLENHSSYFLNVHRFIDFDNFLPDNTISESLRVLEKELSQCFCRVTLDGSKINFRITSVQFDWFDSIRNMLIDLTNSGGYNIEYLSILRTNAFTDEDTRIIDYNGRSWCGTRRNAPADFIRNKCNSLLPYPYIGKHRRGHTASILRNGYSLKEACDEVKMYCWHILEYMHDLVRFDVSYNQ